MKQKLQIFKKENNNMMQLLEADIFVKKVWMKFQKMTLLNSNECKYCFGDTLAVFQWIQCEKFDPFFALQSDLFPIFKLIIFLSYANP